MGAFHLFTLAGVPVSVSPWYLLLLLVFGYNNPAEGLVIGGCITLGLLAHEFGHALVARYFKLQPHIVLHGFGALTGHERARRPRDEALIIAAGPLAGLLLAGGFVMLSRVVPIHSARALAILNYCIFINFFWSVFNLLPMWPMDGGQLLRLGANKLLKPTRADRVTHIVAIAVVGLVAVGSPRVFVDSWMLMILAITAWQNFQALSQMRTASPPPRANPFTLELFERANRAYEQGDDAEAARLCHQLRAEGNVPAAAMARAWVILGVTTTRKGDYQEALSYLRRAPESPDVIEATAQCLYQLEMFDALEELVNTKAFGRLPNETRADIVSALAERAVPKPA